MQPMLPVDAHDHHCHDCANGCDSIVFGEVLGGFWAQATARSALLVGRFHGNTHCEPLQVPFVSQRQGRRTGLPNIGIQV